MLHNFFYIFLIVKQPFEFFHEFLYILKLPVDRSKSHLGNLIDALLLHTTSTITHGPGTSTLPQPSLTPG
ncbi:MAG: hypothetical protein L0922_01350, partial [Candidatus Mariimomonas ferrooxydans]